MLILFLHPAYHLQPKHAEHDYEIFFTAVETGRLRQAMIWLVRRHAPPRARQTSIARLPDLVARRHFRTTRLTSIQIISCIAVARAQPVTCSKSRPSHPRAHLTMLKSSKQHLQRAFSRRIWLDCRLLDYWQCMCVVGEAESCV